MMTLTSPTPAKRRRLLPRLLAITALLLLLTGQAPTWATATTAPEFGFLALVNHERATRGAAPGTERGHLRWSCPGRGRPRRPAATPWSHSGSGSNVLRDVGLRYPQVSMAGENVGYASTVAGLQRAPSWTPPEHRKNILDTGFASSASASPNPVSGCGSPRHSLPPAARYLPRTPPPALPSRHAGKPSVVQAAWSVLATSAEYDVAGGRAQDFARGAIF